MRVRIPRTLLSLTGFSAAALGFFLACASSDPQGEPTDGPAPKPSGTTTGTTKPSDPPPATADAPSGPKKPTRFLEAKGVLHMHSPYSHDACDGNGLDQGVPNAGCLADLRAAPCKTGYDFIALTDHPAHMNEYEPIKNVLHDAAAGDELVTGADGAVIGNKIKCPDGRKVLFTYGYEGNHTLPLVFKKHPTRYDGYESTRPLAEVQALVADLHDAGAVVALAHSEGPDIDVPTIVQGGADAMEWYNPHGNFKTAIGTADGDKIGGSAVEVIPFFRNLDTFLTGSTSGAHPDLFYLMLLPKWPQAGFDRWREVQKSRHVPGVLGSDIHQNVSVDPVCKGATAQALCLSLLGGSKPSALALLVSGGQLIMSDGRRFDAYERLMRWLHNRVYVKTLSPDDLQEGIARGRSYGLFSVFGEPSDFFFDGDAAGKPVDMGDEAKGPVTLHVQLPTAPAPVPSGATFDAATAKKAEVRATLFRTDANGTVEVAKASGLGQLLTPTVTEPGSYHVEVWIRPKHFAGMLGDQAALSNTEYMWLITNPIRVVK